MFVLSLRRFGRSREKRVISYYMGPLGHVVRRYRDPLLTVRFFSMPSETGVAFQIQMINLPTLLSSLSHHRLTLLIFKPVVLLWPVAPSSLAAAH